MSIKETVEEVLASLVLIVVYAVTFVLGKVDSITLEKVKNGGKITLKGAYYILISMIAFRFSNPILHEFGHLFAANLAGYEVTDVNLWSYGGEGAHISVEGEDRSSWNWFGVAIAGALTNLVLAVFVARNWNWAEKALSVRWPTLGYAAIGIMFSAFLDALYMTTNYFGTEHGDVLILQRFFERRGMEWFGQNPQWFIGIAFTVIVLYHGLYFIKKNTSPVEVQLLNADPDE